MNFLKTAIILAMILLASGKEEINRTRDKRQQTAYYSKRGNRPPPYAVQMEPIVQYSPRDPLYNPSVSSKSDDRAFHDDPPFYNNYSTEPEPIIEIIIKESNETLPTPAPLAAATPTRPTREPIQVFYVKYEKKKGHGDGKSRLIYDLPVPALNPVEEHEIVKSEENSERRGPTERPIVRATESPINEPSTTLRAIIHPESEIYHSGSSGIRVTFGTDQIPPNNHRKRSDVNLNSSNSSGQFTSPTSLPPPGSPKRQHGPYHPLQPILRSPSAFPQQRIVNSFAPQQQLPPNFPGSRLHFQPPSNGPLNARPQQQQQQQRAPITIQGLPDVQQRSPFQNFGPPHRISINHPQQPGFPNSLSISHQSVHIQNQPPSLLPAGNFHSDLQKLNPHQQQLQQPHQQHQLQLQQHQQQLQPQQQQLLPQKQLQSQQQQLLPQQQLQPQQQQLLPQQQLQPQQQQLLPQQQLQPQQQQQQQQQQQILSYKQQELEKQRYHQEQRRQQEVRYREQQRQQEQQRQAELERQQDNQRKLEQARIIEQQRQHDIQRQQERQRHQDEQRRIEEQQRYHLEQQQRRKQEQDKLLQDQQYRQQLKFGQSQIQNRPYNQQQKPNSEILKAVPKLEQHYAIRENPLHPGPFPPNPQIHPLQYPESGDKDFSQSGPIIGDHSQQYFARNPTIQSASIATSQQQQQSQRQKFQQQNSITKSQNQNENYQNDQQSFFAQNLPTPQQSGLQTSSRQSTWGGPIFHETSKEKIYATPLTSANDIGPASTERTIVASSVKFLSTTTTTTTETTTTTTQAPSTTGPTTVGPRNEAKIKANIANLPDEVPDDIREQLLSSGILGNADIQILDYDKVGGVDIENLPPEALANFYGAGGGSATAASEPIPAVAKKPASTQQRTRNKKKATLTKVEHATLRPGGVEMKVVHFDPNTAQGQAIADRHIRDDATRLNPVSIGPKNTEQYNRYLPLKVSGASFPIPNAPELKGRKISSVVVLAPVDYSGFHDNERNDDDANIQEREDRDDTRQSRMLAGAQSVKFLAGDSLKQLVKKPSAENYKKWLEQESHTEPQRQSVVLLVTTPNDDSQGDKEIFMYDVSSQLVSKLSGDLSSAFVNAAESNSDSSDTIDDSAFATY